jgi:hypothetical protein
VSVESYIEDNEKEQINAIHDGQNPKEDPSCFCWEKESKASSRMIKKKLELLPKTAANRNEFRHGPNRKPQHARKSGVSNDDKITSNQQDKFGIAERDKRIWSECKAEIVETCC